MENFYKLEIPSDERTLYPSAKVPINPPSILHETGTPIGKKLIHIGSIKRLANRGISRVPAK